MNMVTATEGLMIVTLVMATISMTLSCMALWPQWKDSITMVRDTVLWIALVVIVVGAVTLSWNRLARPRPGPSSPSLLDPADQLTVDYRP